MVKNLEMPGQATAGQLQAATLPVRVIYQSVSTPLRAVSTWCCHSRDQPKSATMLPSKWTR